MHRCAITLLSIAGLAAVGPASSAALVVSEVMSQTTSGTASAINGDWWELTNTGHSAVMIAGFHWADTEDQVGGPTPQPNFFPAMTLAAGKSLIVLEEESANVAAWRANWGVDASLQIVATDQRTPSPGASDTFSGLGSGGDAVFLYDPMGNLIDAFIFGKVTRGVTFEKDRQGNDLGLSVIGENGAVLGANGDVGSPGATVPTPAAGMILLVGLAAMPRRVNRR